MTEDDTGLAAAEERLLLAKVKSALATRPGFRDGINKLLRRYNADGVPSSYNPVRDYLEATVESAYYRSLLHHADNAGSAFPSRLASALQSDAE